MHTYDYVVVGGGTAGCIVASRLSEEPDVSVLLLEAGGDERRMDVETPEAWPTLADSDADWGYRTIPQRGTGHRYPAPRGKILGGSGSINVMSHVHGHRSDFDAWAYAGAEGWNYDGVLPYFKRTEDVPEGDPAYRGRGGPLSPQPTKRPHPLTLAHVEAARQVGHEVVSDLNTAGLMGASCHDLLIRNGQRQSAASAYLRPVMDRANLTVKTGAIARQLSVKAGRCRGVQYQTGGTLKWADALGEVVLCAGAVATPHLLLLSGIGPADELSDLGISPVADHPEVGQNLQDHVVLAGIRYQADHPLPPPSGNFAESTVFVSSDPQRPGPDLQVVQLQVDYHMPWHEPKANSFSFGIGHMRPRSRGSLRLLSADPGVPPRIDPAYVSDTYDIDQLIAGIEIVDQLTKTSAFDEWGGTSDTNAVLKLDRPQLERTVRDAVSSFFHLSGTCRMGQDPAAVVDAQLQVQGMPGLRIADASVMPTIVSCNTNATTAMIGEKAADLLRQGAR